MLCRHVPIRSVTSPGWRMQQQPRMTISQQRSKSVPSMIASIKQHRHNSSMFLATCHTARPGAVLTRPSTISRQCISKTKPSSSFSFFISSSSNSNSNKRIRLSSSISASSSPSPSPSSSSSSSSSSSAAIDPSQQLTWNRFLALRKVRRRIGLIASVGCATGCLTGGIYAIQTRDIDNLGAQMLGMDPFIVLGLVTIACGAAGWLMGPFFGGAVFNLMFRSQRSQITAKENEFFARIKKNRVDPTHSSFGNPVPDYYGEKVGSVTDYRRWLKDQRAFNLKRDKILQ